MEDFSMTLNRRIKALLERMFPVPLNYDTILASLGKPNDEPILSLTYLKDRVFSYYRNYELGRASKVYENKFQEIGIQELIPFMVRRIK